MCPLGASRVQRAAALQCPRNTWTPEILGRHTQFTSPLDFDPAGPATMTDPESGDILLNSRPPGGEQPSEPCRHLPRFRAAPRHLSSAHAGFKAQTRIVPAVQLNANIDQLTVQSRMNETSGVQSWGIRGHPTQIAAAGWPAEIGAVSRRFGSQSASIQSSQRVPSG